MTRFFLPLVSLAVTLYLASQVFAAVAPAFRAINATLATAAQTAAATDAAGRPINQR